MHVPLDTGVVGDDINVRRLQAALVVGTHEASIAAKHPVDHVDDAMPGAKVHLQRCVRPCVGALQRLRHRRVQRNVGTAKPVNRLFRITDQAQGTGTQGQRGPVLRSCAGNGREQKSELRLERVGVLELVDDDQVPAIAKRVAHRGMVANQVARADQQVLKRDEAARPPLVPVRERGIVQLHRDGAGDCGARFLDRVFDSLAHRPHRLLYAPARVAVVVALRTYIEARRPVKDDEGGEGLIDRGDLL